MADDTRSGAEHTRRPDEGRQQRTAPAKDTSQDQPPQNTSGGHGPSADEASASASGGAKAGVPSREHPRTPHSSDELELIRRHAMLAAATASGLKGEAIRVIDMHELVTYTDYLVVCSGRSTRQTRRIAEEVTLRLKKELGLLPAHTEGTGDGEWILVDYLDFIVHVFTPEAREFYRLDNLWKEAPAEVIE